MHHIGRTAQVTGPVDLRRAQPGRLGKPVGGNLSRVRISHPLRPPEQVVSKRCYVITPDPSVWMMVQKFL